MSEGFKQTQTERCVVYCVSDIRVIHMAPSAGSLCFPPTADFHPCSPRGAGVGVGKAGQSGRPQQSGRPRPLTGACPRSTGARRGTGGGSGGKGVRQPGRAPCVLVGHCAERQERSSMACSKQAWVSLTWAVPDAEQPIHPLWERSG